MAVSKTKLGGGVALAACLLLATTSRSKADPAVVGIEATCPATGPGLVACGTIGLGIHELYKAASGQDAFGPNGEIMKLLAVPVHIVDGNVKGSERESGDLAKVLRATLGISARDIDRYGIWGGPNSIFRKPFG